MECQDFEGKQLDKDLLYEGNKVYSKETCVFVTSMVNSFTTDCGASRGEWLLGVGWRKDRNKFMSSCSNPFTKKREHLGYFDCEIEAHQEWLKRKLELAHLLAAEQTDTRVAKALIERYTNYTNWGGWCPKKKRECYMSELIKSRCKVCASIVGVLKRDGTNSEAKNVADKIAATHCKSESGRGWDTSNGIKKHPKVEMNEFSELF